MVHRGKEMINYPVQPRKENTPDSTSSFGDVLSASLENENAAYNLLTNDWNTFEPVEGYDSLSTESLGEYAGQSSLFIDSKSPKEQEYIKRDIDKKNRNSHIIDSYGWTGTAIELGSSLIDVTSFFPFGAAAKGGSLLTKVARSSVAGAVDGAVTETVLGATQQSRTYDEQSTNVLMSTIFGGLVGGAASAMSRGDYTRLETKFNDEFNPNNTIEYQDRHAGAMEADKPTLESERVKGEAATKISGKMGLSSGARLSTSSFAEVRRAHSDLASNINHTGKNDKGVATENSAEDMINKRNGAEKFKTSNSVKANFESYKSAGGELNRDGFAKEVGTVIFSGVKSKNASVQRAADDYTDFRAKNGDEGVSKGFFKEEEKTAGSRIYLQEEIRNNPEKFDQIVSENVEAGLKLERVTMDKKIDKLRVQVEDLKAVNKINTSKMSIDDKVVFIKDNIKTKQNLMGFKDKGLDKLINKFKKDLDIRISKLDESLDTKRLERNSILEIDPKEYAESARNNIINGNSGFGEDIIGDATLFKPGGFKGRTLKVSDEKLVAAGFLDTNIDNLYVKMINDSSISYEMHNKFGDGDAAEYLKEVYDKGMLKVSKEPDVKKKKALQNELNDNMKDLVSLRDMNLNIFSKGSMTGGLSDARRIVKGLAYMTMLGGVMLSSIPDIAMLVFRDGFADTFKTMAATLPSSFKNTSWKKELGEELGIGVDAVNGSTLAARMDIEEYGPNPSKVGELIMKGTRIASKVTLIEGWNISMKRMAAVSAQRRVLRAAKAANDGKLKKSERAYLAKHGLDSVKLRAIYLEQVKHGGMDGNVQLSGVAKWDNDVLGDDYGTSIYKMVNNTIITPGNSDTPIILKTETGKFFGQFKTFLLASHNKILLSGMQQADSNAAAGLISLLTLGYVGYAAKQIVKGEEINTDPMTMLSEGVQQSGVIAVLSTLNGLAESLTDGEIGMSAITGNRSARYFNRSTASFILGPGVSLLEGYASFISSMFSGAKSETVLKNGLRSTPLAGTFYVKHLVNKINGERVY